MMEKYKINTAAADFKLAVKDIAAIIKEYSGTEKKSGSTLTEEEVNIIFAALTLKNEVKSFDKYFETGKAAREQQEKAKKAKKDQNLAAQMAILEQLKAAQEAEMAAKRKEKEAKEAPKKAEPKKEASKAEPKKAEPKKTAKAEVKTEHKPSDPKPFEARKKEDRPAGAAPNRGPAERRTVDTRFSNVDMEKYNEKYENIAPANSMRDDAQRKQKINQKSQNYRRQEKSKKEIEAEKMRRIQLERIKKTPITVTVGDEITVGQLAAALKKTAAEVIKELMKLGMMASVNQTIDYDTAEIVVTEMGAKIERAVVVTIEEQIMDETEDTAENLLPRSPVVVVMGHVDHGKTSLLDAIRNTAVTDTEAGGITQHIGAYRVNAKGQDITFLDTPGHAAFTSMRQRGAMATDIAILVVAADDGIMPQTIEAINHAKAAEVQIIVAINKMDKPEANPDRIKQQLTEHSLVPEEWGGDIICVPVSAKTHDGIDTLLENVLLVAEMLELKANPNRKAKGVVIEARLDKGRGPIATLLVQNGTLKTGDIVIAGTSVGRVRVMTNERGAKLKEAGPSVPVEVAGLTEVPTAGDVFDAVSNERLARELVEQRKQKIKDEAQAAASKVTLDNLFDKLGEGELKELKLIVKADVQGSVEAVKQSLEKLSNDEVRVKVIHGAAGGINETDVMLAQTSGAIIVGFNVRPDAVAKAAAERDGVDMRLYRVIYDAIEEIESAMKGMLAPKYRDVEMGAIEVRNTFKISGVGTIAGGYVTEGKITRACNIRVVRDGVIVAEDKIDSLKRFKDDVKEVAQGYECGISLEKFADIKEGDIFEAYIVEEYRD
ncbi:MAG: translation initiation factor IF-2 [Ruminococcaceae bacterium]|nr:translation initiation factor IF-2 [Oscillospiraceae bacterium]